MKRIVFYVFFAAVLSLFYSCGSSKPIQKYLLVPLAENESSSSQTADDNNIKIAAGIIEFPEYLTSPQIISFKKSNELYRDEYNRWASPLQSNFEKVLLEDISTYIPTDKILLYGSESLGYNVYRINVVVTEFGLQVDSSIVLTARWGTPLMRNSFTLNKKSSFSEDGRGTDYNKQVHILSELTSKLAKEIADEIKLKNSEIDKN